MNNPDRDDLSSNVRSEAAAADPIAMARRDMKRALPRRFYTAAVAGPVAEGGFGVFLDGKPVRTPARSVLAVPSSSLAEVLAGEWLAQQELIEPDRMPMTRLCNSAIDGVRAAIEPTIADIANYAGTDLVCYRAGDPSALVAAQSAAWDPVLAFARRDLGARFVCAEGVMYVAQPEAALAAVRQAIEVIARRPGGPFRLAALGVMTNLSGSVLLALAVEREVMTVETAWNAAHVDEDYQARMWGVDEEAMHRREKRWRDMSAAAKVMRLVA